MSDFNSSLPVRTQNNGDVVVELADGTTPSQKAAVSAAGSVQVAGQGVAGTPAGGVVSVQGVSGGTTVPVSGTVTANQGTAAALAGAWPVEITDGTNVLGTSTHPIRIDPTGTTPQPVTQSTSPWVDNITQIGGSAISLGQKTMANSLPVVIASDQSAVASNITQIGGSTPSASNFLPAQITTGSAYVSLSNPLPVEIVNPASSGTFKNYYTDSVAVGVGSTATQSTTAAGATGFYLQDILVAGSGKFKAQIQIETGVATGVFNVFWTVFNSTATPNMNIPIPNQTLIPTGVRIQVLMTNNDVSAQDLYSTLMGYQI